MKLSWAEIRSRVVSRAGNRCEYCRMHQSLQGATFHVEHVIPRSREGPDDLSNLALSCPSCNLAKSDRITIVDEEHGVEISLYNPRINRWSDHFQWDEERRVVGRTPTGRATVIALHYNDPRRILIREAEEWFDLFPPEDT